MYLRDCGVKLVGIDAMNIDDTSRDASHGKSRPVHSTLHDADILIVEHLCSLGALPDEGFAFSAIPPKVQGRRHIPGAGAGSVAVAVVPHLLWRSRPKSKPCPVNRFRTTPSSCGTLTRGVTRGR